MSYLFDQKTSHEAACEAAIKAGDTEKAVFHAAKAAEFGFALAERTGGAIGARHAEDAEGWLEIAGKLRQSPLPKAGNGSTAQRSNGSTIKRSNDPTIQRSNDQTIQRSNDQTIKRSNDQPPPSSDADEFLVAEDTGVTFDDIDGMAEAKAAIREMVILPMQAPEKAAALGIKAGGGVLLYGPPGNGKTMFGKAIAHEIAAPFFYASGAQIRSKWHGESEQKLSRLLHAAQSRPLAVLFLDEVDGLLPRRTAESSAVDNRLVTQFLSDVGGFKDSPNTLLILGATNKPWEIDEAVFRTGRFDEKLHIGVPDSAARLGMLRRSFKTAPLAPDVDLPAWAERLENYSGSDVVGLASKAAQIAFRRSIDESADPVVRASDLEAAVRAIPSSITPALLAQYDAFDRQRFG